MVKATTAFLAGAGLTAVGLAYLKHTQPNNPIFQYLTNPAIYNENNVLKTEFNKALQQLAQHNKATAITAPPFPMPDHLARKKTYSAMGSMGGRTQRQEVFGMNQAGIKNYSAMPFDEVTHYGTSTLMPWIVKPDIMARRQTYAAMPIKQQPYQRRFAQMPIKRPSHQVPFAQMSYAQKQETFGLAEPGINGRSQVALSFGMS